MGKSQEPARVKLFLGITFGKDADFRHALSKFCKKYGDVELQYGPVSFDYTNYYEEEMGDNLRKVYVSFGRLIDRTELPGIKIFTNELENEFSKNDRRTINIDPGYITNDKFILASTKDFFHRIFLSDGIYAEVTLHFRKGKYRYFSWTYQDYREEGVLEFLKKSRASLVGGLRRSR